MKGPRIASATGTRTRVRRHALLPDRHTWVDIAFTLCTSVGSKVATDRQID